MKSHSQKVVVLCLALMHLMAGCHISNVEPEERMNLDSLFKARSDVMDIAYCLDQYRDIKGNGEYPKNNNDFDLFYNNIPNGSCTFVSFNMINKMYYQRYDGNYQLFIITNYSIISSDLLTCARIANGKIYWKDNCATKGQKINDINWNEVNTLMPEIESNE